MTGPRLTGEQRELVDKHVGLARWAAHNAISYRAYRPYGERLSDAMLALTRAATLYDPARGVAFGSYASTRIRFAVQDGDRSAIGRARYQWWAKREKARARLWQAVGRDPTRAELARELKMTVARFDAVEDLDWRRQHPVEWTHPIAGSGDSVDGLELHEVIRDGRPTAEETAILNADRDMLQAAMSGLTGQQRFVVALVFWEEMPRRDVAELIGVSPSRVSQILAAAYRSMRPVLARERAACAA